MKRIIAFIKEEEIHYIVLATLLVSGAASFAAALIAPLYPGGEDVLRVDPTGSKSLVAAIGFTLAATLLVGITAIVWRLVRPLKKI